MANAITVTKNGQAVAVGTFHVTYTPNDISGGSYHLVGTITLNSSAVLAINDNGAGL